MINFTHKLRVQLREEEEVKAIIDKIPSDEVKMIEAFLTHFLFVSETSTRETLDLKLALKSLPYKVDSFNCYRIGMIHFNMVQKSLIAFQNDD